MVVKRAIVVVCFMLQVLNMLAVPIDPTYSARSELRGSSKHVDSTRDKAEQNTEAMQTMLTQKQNPHPAGDVTTFAYSQQKPQDWTSKMPLTLQKTPASSHQAAVTDPRDARHGSNTNPKPMDTGSSNRLSIPLSSFPSSATPPGTSTVPFPTSLPIPTPSLVGTAIDLSVDSSPEAKPDESLEPEPITYSDVSLGLDYQFVSLPSPKPKPSQTLNSIELSLATSPEPSMEDLEPNPFTYFPFDYDEFEGSGYNPWTATLVFLRRLFR